LYYCLPKTNPRSQVFEAKPKVGQVNRPMVSLNLKKGGHIFILIHGEADGART